MALFKWGTFFLAAAICAVAVFKSRQGKNVLVDFVEKYNVIFFAAIIAAGAFIRFYRLTDIPAGMHVDEWAIAYDAWAHMEYGVDRHLNHNPVYLINYGGGQNVLLFYLTMLCSWLFGGTNAFAVRFPVAFMGTAAIAAVYMLVKKTEDSFTAVAAAFLVAVFPAMINMSRFGLESYLLYSVFIIAVTVFVYGAEKESGIMYLLAGVLFGLTLYSYAIAYLIVPLFLLMALSYLLLCRRVKIKHIAVMALPLFVLALPLMLMLYINSTDMAEIQTSFITIPKLLEYRGGEVSAENIKNIVQTVKNILLNDWLPYNSDPVFNTTYIVTIPLFFTGIAVTAVKVFKAIKSKSYSGSVLVTAAFIAVGITICFVSDVNVNKANAVYPFIAVFAAVAIRFAADRIKAAPAVILVVYTVFFSMFAHWYMGNDMVINTLFAPPLEQSFEIAYSTGTQKEIVFLDTNTYQRDVHLALTTRLPVDRANKLINGEKIKADWTPLYPVTTNENGNTVPYADKESVYIISKYDRTEDYSYIAQLLSEQGFVCETTDFYEVYYFR